MYDLLRLYADMLDMPKEAAASAAEKRRKRQQYYERNRNKILQRNAMYRANNSANLRRKAKIYRMKVKSGMTRQRKRQRVGHGYIYTGMK